MTHSQMHWSQTSCLCMCHYTAHGECTDKDCRKMIAAQARLTVAPVTAQAGSTYGFETPLGRTKRFVM